VHLLGDAQLVLGLPRLALRGAANKPVPVQTELSGQFTPAMKSIVPWRSDSGLQYKNALILKPGGIKSPAFQTKYSLPAFNFTRDLSGGFYEDGIYGPVKLTKTNAITVSLLAWSMLDARSSFVKDPIFLVRRSSFAPCLSLRTRFSSFPPWPTGRRCICFCLGSPEGNGTWRWMGLAADPWALVAGRSMVHAAVSGRCGGLHTCLPLSLHDARSVPGRACGHASLYAPLQPG
jgi:hypothetical protein